MGTPVATPVATLVAFSKKQATSDQVMRALVEHDDWSIPALMLPGEPKVVENLVIYAEEFSIREDTLLVFTDRAAMDVGAQKVGHKAMGLYGRKVKGTALFGQLERPALAKVKELVVNAGSPQEQSWFIKRDGFVMCGAWADAVKCERNLLDEQADVFATLREYEGFWVAIAKVDQTMVQASVPNKGQCVFVFTAPDKYQQFLNGLGERASQVASIVVPGTKLFAFLLTTKVDGFVLNQAATFSRDVMTAIASPEA